MVMAGFMFVIPDLDMDQGYWLRGVNREMGWFGI